MNPSAILGATQVCILPIVLGALGLIATSGAAMANANKYQKYQRFQVETPIDTACDEAFSRQLKNPNFGTVRQINLFNDGRIYRALFDGEAAEVLIVANNRSTPGCTYFRTISGIVHKVETAYTRDKGWIVRYNGDYGQISSELIGRQNLFLDPQQPSLRFTDSQGVPHSFTIFREEIKEGSTPLTAIPSPSTNTTVVANLPDANYRYCNYAPTGDTATANQKRSGLWCFTFSKRSNQVVGVLRLMSNTTGKDGLCIQGKLNGNTINGQLFYTPFAGPYFGPYQWAANTSLQSVLEYIVRQQPAVYGFFGTTDFLDARQPYIKGQHLIFFPIATLNLSLLARHSAGSLVPPMTCTSGV